MLKVKMSACARFSQTLLSATSKIGLIPWRPLSLTTSLESRTRRRGRGSDSKHYWSLEEDAEHFDALEGFINQEGTTQGDGLQLQRKTQELIHRELQQQQRRLSRKITERRFFKQTPETNLLTWKAKQQIRYLNQEFPEEWTVEQLAESFPISVEGVRRLLRNSYTPRSEQEIAKHDRRVMAHWQQLQQTLSARGDNTTALDEDQRASFQHIIDAGKLPLMINAGGSLKLPGPVVKVDDAPESRKVGLFESIVAGTPMVTAQQQEQASKVKLSEGQKETGHKLLEKIVNSQGGKEGKRVLKNALDRPTRR